jgi:antitoxin ParD1/3/4
MNVNLGPVFDKFVAGMLDSGLYQSQSEILREGLRLLKEREDLKKLRLAELREQVARGAEQADRGDFVDGPLTFRKIREKSTQRKRARVPATQRGAKLFHALTRASDPQERNRLAKKLDDRLMRD